MRSASLRHGFQRLDPGHNVIAALIPVGNVQAVEHDIHDFGAEQHEEWYSSSGIVPVNKATLTKVSSSPVMGKDENSALMLDPTELANAFYVDYSHYDAKMWNEEFNKIFFE